MAQEKVAHVYGILDGEIKAIATRMLDDSWLIEFAGRKDTAQKIGEVQKKFEAAGLELRVIPPEGVGTAALKRNPSTGAMNTPQRVVLLVAAVIMALMLIFPPFHTVVVDQGQTVLMNLGYGAIWSPPAFERRPQVLGEVNVPLLLIQVVVVAVAAVMISAALRSRSSG